MFLAIPLFVIAGATARTGSATKLFSLALRHSAQNVLLPRRQQGDDNGKVDDDGKVNGNEMINHGGNDTIYKFPALLLLQLYKVHWKMTDRTLRDQIIDIVSPCRGSKSFERGIN